MSFLENEFFLLAVTFAVYTGARWLQKRKGRIRLNRNIVSVGVRVGLLQRTDLGYVAYKEGGQLVEVWLKPAVIALEVALDLQM